MSCIRSGIGLGIEGLTTAPDVPCGAPILHQELAWNSLATPIARMVPTLARSPAVSVSANITWTWPDTSASTAGAPPLIGTCTMSTPVIILNISAEMSFALPAPAEAKFTLPGFALA